MMCKPNTLSVGQFIVILILMTGVVLAREPDKSLYRRQTREAARHETKMYQRQLDFMIYEIDRTCGLTDEQKQKLQVAAKGAIEQALAPRLAVFNEADEPSAKVIDARITAEQTRVQGLLNRALALKLDGIELPWSAYGQSRQLVTDDAALQSPRWKNAMQSILSAQQRQQYQAAKRSRLDAVTKLRSKIVSGQAGRIIDRPTRNDFSGRIVFQNDKTLLAQLDMLLFLSDSQHVKMERLLAEVVKNQFARQFLMNSPSGALRDQLMLIPYSSAKTFLDKEQLVFWRTD
jgi:RNA polymerase-interacting CarD/CdnL/TRCF family regulator